MVDTVVQAHRRAGPRGSNRGIGGNRPDCVRRLPTNDDPHREGKGLPFEPLTPNAETIEAMKAARRGDLVSSGLIDALFADLNAGD